MDSILEQVFGVSEIALFCGLNPHSVSPILLQAVKAMEHARGRSGDTVAEVALTVEDIFFLMRRDKVHI